MAILNLERLYIILLSFLYLVCCLKECQPGKEDGIYDFSSCYYIRFRNLTEFRLDEGIAVSNQVGFHMIGNAFNKTKIHCSNIAGITLRNVSDIIINNIEFYGCGEWHSYSSENVTAAIWMMNCTNINISNISFYESYGTALVLINTSGFVQIARCLFQSGGISGLEEMAFSGGGGIHIQQPPASDTSVNVSVTDCEFSSNEAVGTCCPDTCETAGNFGYGGGFAIFLYKSSADVFVSIKNCHFWNNSAIAGGGVEIAICSSLQSAIEFENVAFYDNSASQEGGGALDILWNEKYEADNSVTLSNVQFLRNYALYGGGIAVAINTKVDSNSHILIISCLWVDNRALFGSAIDIFPEKNINDQVTANLSILDSNFINNSNCNMPDKEINGQYLRGFGVIMIAGNKISFTGTIQFSDSSGSCIYAVGSEIHFDGANVSFNRNIAEYGSGITVVGLSKITTNHNCHIRFCSNYAEKESPTIYYCPVDKHHFLNSQRYSYEFFSDPSGSALFEEQGNLGPTDKRYPYSMLVEKPTSLHGINFSVSDSCNYQLSENYLYRDITTCKSSSITNNQKPEFTFIPGIERKLNETKSDIQFRVTLYQNSSELVSLPDIYETITNKLMLQGKPGSTAEVILHSMNFNKTNEAFRAKLTDCPALYKLSNENKCTCVSPSDIHFHSSFMCQYNGSISYSSISSGYWIGYELSNNNITLMGRCPIGFCNSMSKWIELNYTDTKNSTTFDKVLCNRRQGRLCGTCANGTVVFVHSRTYKCGDMDLCNWGWAFFLLAEILPLTAIFLGVVFFRVKLTAGGVSGFIFFAQMYVYTNTRLEALTKYTIPYKYTAFHHFIYQLFNLDFAEFDSLSFCFSDKLKNLDVLILEYAVSLYCFALILLTILFTKFSRRFKMAKWMVSSKHSIIEALSTLIIMVYSKCTFTTFSILWNQQLYSGIHPTIRVISLQGDMEFFSTQHLPYAVTAIFVLVLFTISLPLILLLYPLSNKVISKLGLGEMLVVRIISKMLPLSKFLPFFDFFQGTFKNQYRFFSGLYFIYRIMVLASVMNPIVSMSYLTVTLLVITMLVVHTLAWPYKKNTHNAIDALLFANLAIIFGLKVFIVLLEDDNASNEIKIVHSVEIVLVNLPIAAVAIYFVAHGCIAVKNLGKRSVISQTSSQDIFLSDDVRQENLDDYHAMNMLS